MRGRWYLPKGYRQSPKTRAKRYVSRQQRGCMDSVVGAIFLLLLIGWLFT